MKKLAILLFLFSFASLEARFITRVKPAQTIKVKKVDNSMWNAWLRKYVRSNGWVKYRQGRKEKTVVLEYIKYLLSIKVSSLRGRNEKLAYYINLYNALTVYQVLNNYPMKSVMTKFANNGFFKAKFYLGGRARSLDDLEKKIILPRFRNGLVHFALNCASYSCPPLLRKAYTGRGLSWRLRVQTKKYLNNKRFVKVDKANKTLHLVELFSWYKKDFGDAFKFYNKYSGKKVDFTGYKIQTIKYNWSLNGR